jgi:hypothetical protein
MTFRLCWFSLDMPWIGNLAYFSWDGYAHALAVDISVYRLALRLDSMNIGHSKTGYACLFHTDIMVTRATPPDTCTKSARAQETTSVCLTYKATNSYDKIQISFSLIH